MHYQAVNSLLIGDSCMRTAASFNFGISQIHNTFGILSTVTKHCFILTNKSLRSKWKCKTDNKTQLCTVCLSC